VFGRQGGEERRLPVRQAGVDLVELRVGRDLNRVRGSADVVPLM
jgi:hypothetical protein